MGCNAKKTDNKQHPVVITLCYLYDHSFKTIILYKQSTDCVANALHSPPQSCAYVLIIRVYCLTCFLSVFQVSIISCLNVLSLLISVTRKSSCDLVCLWKAVISRLSFRWRFDPVQGKDLHLRGFTVTLVGHTTLGRTPQDE
jgi:hypothetical protein